MVEVCPRRTNMQYLEEQGPTYEEEPGMHSNHLFILVTPFDITELQIIFEQVFPQCIKAR